MLLLIGLVVIGIGVLAGMLQSVRLYSRFTAILRSQRLCKVYGIIMMVQLLQNCSDLTLGVCFCDWLDCPAHWFGHHSLIIRSEAYRWYGLVVLCSVRAGATCKDYVESMISTTRINAILYGKDQRIISPLSTTLQVLTKSALNCLLDCAGAVYAIKSKELFEFEKIADHHKAFQNSLLL